MKHSSRVMSFVMALTMPTVMVPQSSTPTPANQTASDANPATEEHSQPSKGCGSRRRSRSHCGGRWQGHGRRSRYPVAPKAFGPLAVS